MIEQRSKEWFEQRKERITGSNVGAILGLSPYKKPADVMREMVRAYHDAEREFKGNPATEWGTHNEPGATKQMEMLHLDQPVQECGLFIHPEHDWLAASPDGLIGDRGVAEIKCPYGQRDKTAPLFKTLEEQPHYMAQTQIEMACASRDYVEFYQWAPYGDSIETDHLNQQWLDENIPKLKEFYDAYLIEREMPNALRYLEPKHKEQSDRLIVEIANEYKSIGETIKKLETKKKDLLAELVERCGERDSEINGHKLTKVVRKGSVSYAKIPELKGVDLEQYRGNASEYWSFK